MSARPAATMAPTRQSTAVPTTRAREPGADAEGEQLGAGGVAGDEGAAPGVGQVDPVDVLVGQVVEDGGVHEPAADDDEHGGEQRVEPVGGAGGGQPEGGEEQEHERRPVGAPS